MIKRHQWAIYHMASQHTQRKLPIPGSLFHILDKEEFSSWSEDIAFWLNEIEALIHGLTYEPLHMWFRQHYPSDEKKIVLAHLIAGQMHTFKIKGATYQTIGCSDYPELLRYIPDPPLALTFLGSALHKKIECLGLVGSRRASFGALKECYETGRLLAEKQNICLVSGGAYGCDITAHKGSLSTEVNPLYTATVFAGGLGVLYPQTHLGVFSQLVQRGGCLISERLWYAEPKPYDFPHRNRIISGLCRKIIVIHAGQKSGAMTTCHHALHQGRDLLVLHPQFGDETMDGNERLITDGASSFFNTKELVDKLF